MKKIILPVILVFSLSVQAQPKYDKTMAAIEAAYRVGAYKKALSSLEKFKNKSFKKLGNNNPYLVAYHLMIAKCDLASGMYDFEKDLKTAIATSIAVNSESSKNHGMVLLEAAALYTRYGSFVVAKQHLAEAKDIFTKGDFFNEDIKAQWEVAQAEVLQGQGFYVQASELLIDNSVYFAGRAVKQETYVDDKGNLKSRKLPEEELAKRYDDYCRVVTLLGRCYARQGKLRSADSAFAFVASWATKNLGQSSVAYVRNQFYNAKMLKENGNVSLPKSLDFSRIVNNLVSQYKLSHYLAVDIYEEHLKELIKEGGANYVKTKVEYLKVINKHFSKGSFYPLRFDAIELEAKLTDDKIKSLKKDADALLANSKLLPGAVMVNTLEFLSQLALYEKRYSNAESYLKSIIEIKNNLYGEEAPESHLAKIKLANHYLDYTNKISEALEIYEQSFVKIVAPQIGSQHQDILEILNHIGSLYELTDQYAKADSVLEKSIQVARVKYDNKDVAYATQLNNVARIQIKLGEFEKASKKVEEALKIVRDKDSPGENRELHWIEVLETRAILQGLRGLFDDAKESLAQTSRMIAKSDNNVGIDELATGKELTSLLILLGDYNRAEKLLNKLIPEYEKLYGVSSLRLVEPLVNKGRLILAKGDYTEADKVAQRANQIALSVYGDKSSKTASTQKLLGDIDYAIGDYDKAEENIEKALANQQRQFGRNHIEVAKSLAQLSLIKFYKGDEFSSVEKMMQEAQKIMGERLDTDNPQYADILKNVAIINIAAKKYNTAFTSLTQAEGIWRGKTGSKGNINAAAIYTLTGDVFYQIKNYKKSEEFYNQARDIYEKYFNRTHPEYVKILSKQAKVYYMQKDFKKAKKNIEEALNDYENFIKKYFPALSEREKTKFWNTIKSDFEFYNTLAFGNLDDFKDLTGKVYNYQLLTKALLLSSSIKIRERILNSSDENLKKIYNEWLTKKEFLTNALSMSTEQLTLNAIDLPSLNNEVEKLEATLSEKSELFGQSFENKKITYENVQKSIAKNEVAIEMVRYRHFDHNFTDSVIYVALYVKNDDARPKVVELPEGHRMENRFFKYYRNCITGQVPDAYSYKVFWEPIAKAIGINTTIFISPDGVYNQLNLEAIPTPDGKYIIDNANIVIISNSKDLYIRKVKSKGGLPSNTATMFGNPSFYMTASNSNRVAALPGTEKEVNELQDLLNQKGWKTFEYMDKSASEERVKEQESPKIFHIATHGFYSPTVDEDDAKKLTRSEAQLSESPLMKCGLLLRGAGDVLDKTNFNYNIESGILTAYEAMSLNLDKTDLVVLSACETGLGDISNGEGVYGLQRAFLVAGAKVLIMSMFKVDDAATQKLVLTFYKKWLTTNNMRQSFVDAKKELRVEYPDPIYWGAFMMIGIE